MKKTISILFFATIFSLGIKAQNPVLNLSNYLRNGILDKAYENLNQAMADDKYTSDAKTWLLRGNLYYAAYRCYDLVNGIYVGMPDDELRNLKGDPLSDFRKQKTPQGRANKYEWDLGFSVLLINKKVISFVEPANGIYKSIANSSEDALKIAKESYLKTIDLDPMLMVDMTFPGNAYQGLMILSEGYFNLGVQNYNANEPSIAFNNFFDSYDIKGYLKSKVGLGNPNDTLAGYYAVKAAAFYIRQLSEEERFEEAIAVADRAKTITADDIDLALSEADAHLKMKDYLKTKEILEAAIQKQPDNANLYFVIGNIYDKLAKDDGLTSEQIEENYDLSINYYGKALEVNPNYFDALFNLGTMYNNKAVDKLSIAQKLPFGDPNYDPIIKEVDELFAKALPYLEKAHGLNLNDVDPMRMLYSIYARQKKNDEAAAMKEKIDAVTKKE